MSLAAGEGFLRVAGRRLEYRMIGPPPSAAPTVVMLHEGLGCVGLWGDFPDHLQAATGAGVFIYSRAGYGQSDPVALPRPLDYMRTEAVDILPKLLDAIGFRRGLLIGHSDGASIATIYAGSIQDHRIRGLVLIAPHFFVEDIGLSAIAQARELYAHGDLRQRLARWHDNVDVAFRGWNDAWLDPQFRSWDITDALAYIRVPMLALQGTGDQYGTMRQIEVAREECYCPLEIALVEARHAPHKEEPAQTLTIVSGFVNRLLGGHREAEFQE
ncbi:MAG: alpha/beta fold hydrolase [Proteobacteria bacterium]|nr:alpha/beta fold hydrolase [Pseudomonadota bacterium]